MSSDLLEKTLEVTLLKKCSFSWRLLSSFVEYSVIDNLLIELSPECNLKEKSTYVVTFRNRELIVDQDGNSLATEKLKVSTRKYIYLPNEKLLTTAGTIINTASTCTLLFLLALSVFQGYAVGSLWHFVNMIQIISYLPLLDCDIPDNYALVLTEYISIKEVKIPFNMIPKFFYNPLDHFAEFLTSPLNDKFKDLDYESISFMFNFSEDLLTWLMLGLIYILLSLFAWALPKFGYLPLIP